MVFMKAKNSQLKKSSPGFMVEFLGYMVSLQFSSDGIMKSDKNQSLLEWEEIRTQQTQQNHSQNSKALDTGITFTCKRFFVLSIEINCHGTEVQGTAFKIVNICVLPLWADQGLQKVTSNFSNFSWYDVRWSGFPFWQERFSMKTFSGFFLVQWVGFGGFFVCALVWFWFVILFWFLFTCLFWWVPLPPFLFFFLFKGISGYLNISRTKS